MPSAFPNCGLDGKRQSFQRLVTMQVLLPCGRLVLALTLILILDSSVQGKPQDSHSAVIFCVSPRVHTNNYIHFKVQDALDCGEVGKGKGFGD